MILSLEKTHEVRKLDRPFKQGDTLHLREWNPTSEQYTDRHLDVQVTSITRGGRFGLPNDLCVMSIRREEEPRPQIMRLAMEMERKLRLNEHKGGRRVWLGTARIKLIEDLKVEVVELEKAIDDHIEDRGRGLAGILEEAADVANFAMMIADDKELDGTDNLDEVAQAIK